MARRSTGLAQADRQTFLRALRDGVRRINDTDSDDTSPEGPLELWNRENQSLTLVADGAEAALQWEIRGFKVRLTRAQAEQLIATLEEVPALAEQMAH